eukprot:2333798-Amphidinium_carterae.1
MKKNAVGLRYHRLPPGELELHLFSDAAYRVQPENTSGLAVRGMCTALMSRQARGDDSPGGFCHLLDFQSVKQKR